MQHFSWKHFLFRFIYRNMRPSIDWACGYEVNTSLGALHSEVMHCTDSLGNRSDSITTILSERFHSNKEAPLPLSVWHYLFLSTQNGSIYACQFGVSFDSVSKVASYAHMDNDTTLLHKPWLHIHYHRKKYQHKNNRNSKIICCIGIVKGSPRNCKTSSKVYEFPQWLTCLHVL